MPEIKGRGSIVRLEDKPRARCRKWRLVVDMGVDPVSKKRRPPKTRRFPSREEVACGVKGTYSEAQEALRKFIDEVENGPFGAKLSMASLAEEWLERRRKLMASGSISAGTVRRDVVRAKTIASWMGRVKITDVSQDTVLSFYVALRTGEASISGKPLSGTTAQGIAMALDSMMRLALKRRLIRENPCEGLEKPRNDTEEKEALPVEVLRRLIIDLLEGQPDARRMGVLLAITCGLNREELLGLNWGDVSPDALRVRKAHSADEKELTDTKTPFRKRIIPLYPEVRSALEAWRTVQAVQLEGLRIEQTVGTPVITSSVGTRMHPENFAKWWRKWRGSHGLDGIGLHQLRHTFATYLVAGGVDLVTAAGLMGHGSTQMLDRVYAHVVPENKARAMATIGDLMFGPLELEGRKAGGGIPIGIPENGAVASDGFEEGALTCGNDF